MLGLLGWPCFVDATSSRMAGISGHGMFSLPVRSSRPIFEAGFLASLLGIYSHLPYSNKVCLIGGNTGVLYCLQKGSPRNFIANRYLQNLADLWRLVSFLFRFTLCFFSLQSRRFLDALFLN